MIQLYQSLQQENGSKKNDLSDDQYFVNKNIQKYIRRFKIPMLRSDLCEYSDAYIFVKGTITIEGTNANNRMDKI